MRTVMERPIDLDSVTARRLAGETHGRLVLPIRPQPAVTDALRTVLRGGLLELGIWADHFDDVELLDMGFREGLDTAWRCPWGRGGDLLYVREQWAQVGRHYRFCSQDRPPVGGYINWLPAHCMPKEAARLWLKIEDVGVCLDVHGAFAWAIEVERRRGA